MTLTADFVRTILDYDPESGDLLWKINNSKVSGKIAGSISINNYVQCYERLIICINYKKYRAQNIAWLIMTGEFPPTGFVVDHINGNPIDNRWENLRLATRSQNLANARKPKNNKTGFKGVCFDPGRGKYRASIVKNRRHLFLGRFSTPEEAHAAYESAAQTLFGEFARMK